MDRKNADSDLSSRSALRRQAENILDQHPEYLEETPSKSLQETIHELRVHQIELELQNEDLRASQAQLADLHKKYFDLYDLAPVGYITFSAEGIILEANLASVQLLGIERSRLSPFGFSRLLEPDSQGKFYWHIEQTLSTGRKQSVELAVKSGQSQTLYIVMESRPAENASAKSRQVHSIIVDITERKRFEAALSQSEEALRRANEGLERKVENRTADLARAVSELQTEISQRNRAERDLMHANVQLNKRADQLCSLAGKLARAEQQERKRMSRFLHDGLQQYLASAKLQLSGMVGRLQKREFKEQAIKIENILGESLQMCRSLTAELSPPALSEGGISEGLAWLGRWMQDRYQFTVDLLIEDTVDIGEEMKIVVFEAVRELLFNAAKHSKVSRAAIKLQQVDAASIRITVADQGAGFNPLALEKRGADGSGLGLLSIRERLGLIDGRLDIDSAPGKGSRIELTIPCMDAPARASRGGDSPRLTPAVTAGERDRSQVSPRAIKVLIADDHPLYRNGVAALVDGHPDLCVVGYAGDGQEAIDQARGIEPDVILMDVSMPGINGIDATRTINQEAPQIRIIGLSMYEDHERAQEMLAAGAVDYKNKGCSASDLVSAIRASIQRPAA